MGYMDNMNQEVTNTEIFEFLQEHMVVKEDLKNLATKEDIRKLDEKFDKRFESMESRLIEFQTELADIKLKLSAIETKLHEDTNALNSLLFTEVGVLKKRVMFLEQKLGLTGLDFNAVV